MGNCRRILGAVFLQDGARCRDRGNGSIYLQPKPASTPAELNAIGRDAHPLGSGKWRCFQLGTCSPVPQGRPPSPDLSAGRPTYRDCQNGRISLWRTRYLNLALPASRIQPDAFETGVYARSPASGVVPSWELAPLRREATHLAHHTDGRADPSCRLNRVYISSRRTRNLQPGPRVSALANSKVPSWELTSARCRKCQKRELRKIVARALLYISVEHCHGNLRLKCARIPEKGDGLPASEQRSDRASSKP